MAADWREVSLEDVAAEVTVGHVGPMASEYVSEGVPFLRSQNVEPLRINDSDLKFVSQEFHERLRKSALSPGDVVIVRTGKPGSCAVVPKSLPVANCSDLVIVRCGKELAPRFLSYYVNSAASHHVNSHLVGAVQQHFNVASARRMRMRLPPLAEQRRIAHILGTLDDKIELNRRMSETLEAMTRALFKSWFVDFDLARTKTAELIRHGLLEIGDGYRAKNSELGEPGLPFLRAGDLNNGLNTTGADVLNEDNVAKAGSKVSQPGDVAFTSKGTIGRLARVTEHTPRFVYSPQVCFWRSLDEERLAPEVLYCWMRSEEFKAQVLAVAGQTDMAPYVSLRDQRQMDIPLFPVSQRAVADQLKPLFDRQARFAVETKTLSSLRDVLLPRLLSGELPVPVAERVLEAQA